MHAPIAQIVDAWRRPMLRRLPVKCACSGLEIVSRSFARPRASLSVLHVRVCGHVCGGGNCKHGYVFYRLYPFMANGEYVGACGCAVHFVIVRRHMQNTTPANGIFTLHSRCQIHWVYLCVRHAYYFGYVENATVRLYYNNIRKYYGIHVQISGLH